MVTICVAPAASVKDDGDCEKKLPFCESVTFAAELPEFVTANWVVAPPVPAGSSIASGNEVTLTIGPLRTVTVTDAVAVVAPDAVSVYVVVADGDTFREPDV